MDVLYEESAVNARAKKEGKIYKIFHVLSWVWLIIAIFCLMFFLQNLVSLFATVAPSEEITQEQIDEALAMSRSFAFFFGMLTVFFGMLWGFCFIMKKRINISYDYTFVSGELRIAKVFNINKRKLVTRIQPDTVLQLGDVENESYDRLRADPSNKQIILTPNSEPTEGKFFLYAHVAEGTGRKLYILECREELLVNILRFVKRGTLAPDYVSQEKKAQNGG